MKNTLFSCFFILFLISVLYLPNSFAQDYTQWGLPEGAKARLGKGWMNDMAYSPDGMRLAVATDMGIWLYDAQTGEELDRLTGHTDEVHSVSFSPNGEMLASGGWDDTVHLWDAQTGNHVRTLSGQTNGGGSVSFSPDGETLASGGWDDTVRLWDAQTGRHLHTLSEHTDEVNSVSFSPDGEMLASGSDDRTVRLWDAATGAHLYTLEGHTYSVLSLVFSPDGRTLASGGFREIRLWDAATGRHLRTLTGHTNYVYSVVFSPDGRTLISMNGEAIDLLDVETGKHLLLLVRHGLITDTSFSPDGQTLAGASYHEIPLWDTNTGKYLRTLARHQWINSVAFSPDGLMLASGGWQEIRLWNTNTGERLHTLIGHTHWVDSILFSPDGRTLASASRDHTICLWDPVSGQRKQKLTWHPEASQLDPAINVAFSPDSKTLASGSSDPDAGEGTIRLWEVATGRNIHTLTEVEKDTHAHWRNIVEVTSLAFSPDGRTLVNGDTHLIRFWDVPTGKYLRTFRDPFVTGAIYVALSPDGLTLASASGGSQIYLWDVQTSRHIQTLAGNMTGINNLWFSPDGQTLASGSWAGTVLLWDLAPTSPESEGIAEDVNKDGIVNIIDLTLVASNFGKSGENSADVNGDGVVNIIDLTLVAGAFGNAAGAPALWSRDREIAPTREQVQQWLREAQQMNLTDSAFQRGILILEQLLASLTPKETVLLPNYPNPVQSRDVDTRINSQSLRMSAFPSMLWMEGWFGRWY